MEILQTIWTTLTTPNQWLIDIFSIPLSIMEITVSMLLFTTVLNIKTSTKQKVIYVFILSLWTVLSSIFVPKPFVSYINMLISPIVVLFLFQTNIVKAIFSQLIPFVICILLDTITIKVYSMLFHISYFDLAQIPLHRLLSVSLVYFVIYLLYRLAKYFNFSISLLDNMDRKTKLILVLNSVLGIIAIGTQLYLIIYYSDILPLPIVLLSMLSLITYFLISLYSTANIAKLELTNQDLEQTKQYNKTLSILHDNIRAFKHDFNNIVQSIGGYVATEDMQGLKKYYSQLLGDCQRVNNLTTLSPSVINNPAIYNLLTSKYHLADKMGIRIELEVLLDLTTIPVKIYELTRILGILMDNAIEASSECDEKRIRFIMKKDFNINRQLMIIENTYLDKEIDIDKIYKKGFTTKEQNSGIGLWEVTQILNKYPNLNLHTSKNNTYFKQQLEIYLPNKS